ncbi:MAG: DUF1622 domain-containing protein [Cyanobacteriota bacterium]
MRQEPPRNSWANILLPLGLILGLFLLLSLNREPTKERPLSGIPLESWLNEAIGYLAVAAEFAAAFIIGLGIIQGTVSYVRLLFSRSHRRSEAIESIRLQLGRVLTLGLEFAVASDILRTTVAPTRRDILNLGSIVLLRTLLNYFLEREIQEGEENSKTEREQNEEIR